MKLQFALATILALTSATAFTVAAQAETLKVDTSASTITWKATKKLLGGHNGTVAVKEGSVDVNAKNEVTAATIVADMSKIQNADLASSPKDQAKLVGHLSSPDFFDVAKKGNETATFKLSKFAKKNGGWVASGDLTMIGQTHPIEFPVKVKVDKGAATADGMVKVDRTKWGLRYGSGDFNKDLVADKIINNEFEIGFKLIANKK